MNYAILRDDHIPEEWLEVPPKEDTSMTAQIKRIDTTRQTTLDEFGMLNGVHPSDDAFLEEVTQLLANSGEIARGSMGRKATTK